MIPKDPGSIPGTSTSYKQVIILGSERYGHRQQGEEPLRNPGDGKFAGFEDCTYDEPGTISFNHTEVLPTFSGAGVARELVTFILEDARKRDLAVLPFCPYVATVIRKNPDTYLDLVPVPKRKQFGLPA